MPLPVINAPPIRPGKDWFLYVQVQTPSAGERSIWGAEGKLELRDDRDGGEVVLTPLVVVCAAQEGEFALSLTGFDSRDVDATKLRGVLTMVTSESETEDLAEVVVPVEVQ